jgi:stearoyl-CoA desaturase (delta-9 desaturase)
MRPEFHADDIIYPSATAFVLMHFACFAAIWTGVSWGAVGAAFALYVVRMFAITGGFHRYFSHRTYRTSRVFHFLMGFLAESSGQAGVLWWAAKHRHHHKFSDTEDDVHSPRQRGFWFAHFGWVFHKATGPADYSFVPDLERYPELVWLDRNKFAPILLLGTASYLLGGWRGLVVGFCWSTVATYHGTFAINSLAHTAGRQRYLTGDESRNNWWLAIVTLGEGWHNNHHWYQGSTRQGFRWWEYDITYYLLKALSWVGVVWEMKEPPLEVVRGERPVPPSAIERAARLLADTFHREWRRPHLPSLADLRAQAERMFARTQALDDVVRHALEILREKLPSLPTAPSLGPDPEPS